MAYEAIVSVLNTAFGLETTVNMPVLKEYESVLVRLQI